MVGSPACHVSSSLRLSPRRGALAVAVALPIRRRHRPEPPPALARAAPKGRGREALARRVYTERYLGLPEENPAGYDHSSLLSYARYLARPLLLIHGTRDDNVYFFQTLKLCDALFRAGKSFDLLPLAGFTHMVPDPVVKEALYGRIVATLASALAP